RSVYEACGECLMSRVLLVARNAFRGILHARSLYLWIVAILVVGIQLAPQIIFRNNLPNFPAFGNGRGLPPGMSEEQQKELQEARMKQIQEQFRRGRPAALASGLRLWTVLSIAFAILLGASVL